MEINYHIPQVIEEQIKLAEQELRDYEARCAAGINFRRGRIDMLQMVRDGKPAIIIDNINK